MKEEYRQLPETTGRVRRFSLTRTEYVVGQYNSDTMLLKISHVYFLAWCSFVLCVELMLFAFILICCIISCCLDILSGHRLMSSVLFIY